jgi:hypothetical protein
MREIGKEINAALAPQWSGNSIPVGSQWDYDAAIAQARFDLKHAIGKGTALDASYQTAADNLEAMWQRRMSATKETICFSVGQSTGRIN